MSNLNNEYFESLSADRKQVITYINSKFVEKGILNKYAKAGILAITSKESNFRLKAETSYENTDNSRIRKVFGSRVKDYNDAALNALKKDPERFFNVIYGGRFGNAANEGYKYRGRGFNQLTFKANYEKLGEQIKVDLVNNPDKLLELPIATMALFQYFINFFGACPPGILKVYGITPIKLNTVKFPGVNYLNELASLDAAVKSIYHANAGWGKSFANLEADVTGGRAKAISRSPGFLEIVEGAKF